MISFDNMEEYSKSFYCYARFERVITGQKKRSPAEIFSVVVGEFRHSGKNARIAAATARR